MIIDVHGSVAQAGPEIRHAPRALTFLDAARRIRRLADAAVDQTLEADLWIVVDMRAADVDVEERGDVFAVLRLDAACDVPLQTRHRLGDLTFRGSCHTGRGNMKKDEIVVVRKADHEARRTHRRIVEELANGDRGGLEHGVQFFPAVDLLDLRVPHEVQVQHNELTPLFEQRA